jgi:alpha-1,6-mannosyltransferase
VRPHIVDATLFYTPTSGGVRRYLLAKHEWLRTHGRVRHTLFVPGPRDTGTTGEILEFASPPLLAGYRCPVRLKTLRRSLATLAPDLIEAGDPYLMAWQVARFSADSIVPSVAFCHSDVISLTEQRLGRRAGRLAAAYLRRLYSRFDLVLAPSRLVFKRLRAAEIHHVALQPLGVDAQVFAPTGEPERLRRRLGLPPETRLLVFAGRLAPEKNIPELIRTVEHLGDPYHLVIIGGRDSAQPTRQVTILPYAADAASLATLLSACDVLVHAGLQETFGLVALEAMACGLPVVAYEQTAVSELIDKTVGALASRHDPNGLAMAVAQVFQQDREALGQAARARVLAHYTWHEVFTQQLKTYAYLLQRGSLFQPAPPEPTTTVAR